MQYLFELGRNHELSRAEIEQVFLTQKISYTIREQDKEKLFLETNTKIDISKIMSFLGGTIKIAEQIAEKPSLENIIAYLDETQNDGKIQFSLSGNNAKNLALAAKKELKESGRSVRYIEANNTATILHNNLIEKQGDLILTKHGLFVTRAIQAIEEWGERDFGRPGRDDRSGMLPPKLARIMINLTGAENTATLLDPFCGSGTILTEALSLGFQNLVGNDTSEKALEDSTTNIAWMNEQLGTKKPIQARLILGDAASLHGATGKNSIDAIATEPYMGKPLRGNEDKTTLTKQALELGVLYIAAFKSFEKILKPGSPLIFIIPRFKCKNEWVRINILDQIQHFGFSLERLTPSEASILYHRPEQFVGREIWKFRKI